MLPKSRYVAARTAAVLAAFTIPLIFSPAFADSVSTSSESNRAELSPASSSYRFSQGGQEALSQRDRQCSAPTYPDTKEPSVAAGDQGLEGAAAAEPRGAKEQSSAPPERTSDAPFSANGESRATSSDAEIKPLCESLREPIAPVPVAVAPVAIPVAMPVSGPIVVDSDIDDRPAVKERSEKFEWKALPDKPGLERLSAGVEFPVVSVSCLSSKTAKVGDRVGARLKMDLTIGGKLIAPKGTKVEGHVFSCHPARRLLTAELKVHQRWLRANGAIGIRFDEVVTERNEHLPLMAVPAQRSRIVHNKNEGRILGVNHEGQIASPLSIQLKHQGVHLVLRGAAAVGGVFTMGALPIAFGVMGAIDPSFAFMHPVGRNVHHRRLKGFGMGVLSGLPGGFIVTDYVIKGVEAQVKPGDEFLVVLEKDFDGHVATEAELLPSASTKVHGEVLTKTDKKSKKKQKDY